MIPIGAARASMLGGVDIPDTAVAQFAATSWSQGDGTWRDRATADGAQNMSLTGDPQAGTLSDGAESVVGDGTDDYGLFSLPAELDGSGFNSWTLEFAYQSTDSNTNDLFGVVDGNQAFIILPNADEFETDVGNIRLNAADENGNNLLAAPATNPGLDDGNRHDITIIANDQTADDIEFIIDGTNVNINLDSDGLTSFKSWTQDMGVWARNTDGTIGSYRPAGIGAIRLHDTAISQQTISDYPF